MFQRILEITWLAVAALSFGAGIHKTWYHGIGQSWQFFAITALAVLMYFFRRNRRKQE